MAKGVRSLKAFSRCGRVRWEILFFLVVGSVFGILSLRLTPPIGTPDEEQHFARSYQIADGDMVADIDAAGHPGYRLPVNATNYIKLYHQKVAAAGILPSEDEVQESGANNPESKEEAWVDILGSSFYSPASYLPQAAGIKAGETLNLSLKQTFYLGRILNLIFYITLGAAAIYFVWGPLRWIYLAALLNPVSLQLAGSYSPDSQLLGAVALSLALSLRLAQSHGGVKPRAESEVKPSLKLKDLLAILALASLSIFIALQKQIYLVAILPLLLIPWNRFKGRLSPTKIKIIKLSIAGLSVGAIGAWMLLSSGVTGNIPNLQFGAGFSMSGQIHDLITKPGDFVGSFFRTLTDRGALKFNVGGFGRIGWNVFLPIPWFLLLALTYLATLWRSGSAKFNEVEPKDLRRISWILLASSLMTTGAIFVSLYIAATATESPIIAGLQGRYFFVPILVGICALACLASKNREGVKLKLIGKGLNLKQFISEFILLAIIALNLICLASLSSAY